MRLSESDQQRTKLVINSIILAIALYGMSQRDYDFKKTPLAEKVVIDLMAPMQSFLAGVQNNMSAYFKHYAANISASKENDSLKGQIVDLKNEVFSFQETLKESERLKALLNYGNEIPRKKIVARVISWDASDDYKVIRIDKGLKHGIKPQSVVTSSEGLVGYVYRLTNNFADVITILDANNRVDGVVERIRSHGVIEGYGRNRCIMKYVNRTEPIILNDIVLTAGLGNVYPKGIKVGYISRIERESYGITQHVEITPVVDFSKLEEVLILVHDEDHSKELDWKALNQEPTTKGVKR